MAADLRSETFEHIEDIQLHIVGDTAVLTLNPMQGVSLQVWLAPSATLSPRLPGGIEAPDISRRYSSRSKTSDLVSGDSGAKLVSKLNKPTSIVNRWVDMKLS